MGIDTKMVLVCYRATPIARNPKRSALVTCLGLTPAEMVMLYTGSMASLDISTTGLTYTNGWSSSGPILGSVMQTGKKQVNDCVHVGAGERERERKREREIEREERVGERAAGETERGRETEKGEREIERGRERSAYQSIHQKVRIWFCEWWKILLSPVAEKA